MYLFLNIFSIESYQWEDLFLLALLALVIPVYSFKSFQDLHGDEEQIQKLRISTYKKTFILLLLIGLGTTSLWILAERSLFQLGFKVVFNLGFFVSLLMTLGIIMFLYRQISKVKKDPNLITEIRDQMKTLKVNSIMPRDRHEFQWFLLISVTAGICEEIAYRGFMISYWSSSFGVIGATLISSVIFGFAHLYQGPSGMIQTGIAGLIGGILFAVSGGSLLLPILVHIALDINGGTLGYLAFRSDRTDTK